MASPEYRRASALFLVGIYTIVFVGLAAVYIAINYFIQIENAAMGLIIAACAAMTMARNWVQRENGAPSQSRAWSISLACSIVTIVLFAALVALGIAADDQMLQEMQNEGPGLIAGLAAILVVVNLLVIRLGLWIGTRQALKLVAKA